MKRFLIILIMVVLSSLLFPDVFNIFEKRNLLKLEKEELADMVINLRESKEDDGKEISKLNRNIIKLGNKISDADDDLERYKKRKFLWFWRSPVFGITAGLSGMINTENVLRSNLDFLIMINLYNKWFYYTIGYLPFNKQILLGIGFYF